MDEKHFNLAAHYYVPSFRPKNNAPWCAASDGNISKCHEYHGASEKIKLRVSVWANLYGHHSCDSAIMCSRLDSLFFEPAIEHRQYQQRQQRRSQQATDDDDRQGPLHFRAGTDRE